MIISIIAAISENRVIGMNNRLPWCIPEDIKRFKEITKGHTVIMGRKTFESIGELLVERKNIIITRQNNYRVPKAKIFHSIEEVFKCLKKSKEKEIFIIGGEEIFKQTIEFADRIYLTIIHKNIIGDSFFPAIDENKFKEVFCKYYNSSLPYTTRILDRI